MPITGLNGVVGLTSSFIRSLIGRTRIIWYVVYINAKWIYTSKTLECTIRYYAIVLKVIHVTSTCPFISWCSRATNIKWALRGWHYSLNSVDTNYAPIFAEILFKYHHPNSSIFPDLDWNIYSLSITYYFVIFPIP